AGNAALLGCCDVVIATEDSSIGMGGAAMIEGGGLGTFEPREVGPIEVQSANGVVDLRVEDDAAAVQAARRYLSYFRGATDAARPRERGASDASPPRERGASDASPPREPEELRHLIPSNRKRIYDVRK